jgi:hypothetical protein
LTVAFSVIGFAPTWMAVNGFTIATEIDGVKGFSCEHPQCNSAINIVNHAVVKRRMCLRASIEIVRGGLRGIPNSVNANYANRVTGRITTGKYSATNRMSGVPDRLGAERFQFFAG